MADKFYITTPLYYVNAPAHIGHTYTTIAADTLARYMRKAIGKDKVWFLTGTDEHGSKIQRAAEAKGMGPQQFADETVAHFKKLWEILGISYDDFIRTTEERHTFTVKKVLEILYQRGDIYQDKYVGLYCTPCETFWLESQAPDNLCPDCKRQLEKISEVNYFFDLAKHQSWLTGYIKKNSAFIRPESRRNEVLSFLEKNKLTALCISRPKERLSWGIPLPFSAGHVTYVWFDALVNYISAVGEFQGDNYKSRWWPADLHLIGKDILRQHAIYWPIMLKALNIEPPKTIFAHGWWMMGEDKMSKSRGNVINPLEMAEKFGIDVYRYFLLRDMPFGLDGNFSEGALVKRFNADLANDLGNLVYRTLTMVEKYYQGKVPSGAGSFGAQADNIKEKINSLGDQVKSCLAAGADFNFSSSLEKIWELINMANKYVEQTKPWNLAKENRASELESFIRLLVEVVRRVGAEISCFMPKTGLLIDEQIGQDIVKKQGPLFPRYAD